MCACRISIKKNKEKQSVCNLFSKQIFYIVTKVLFKYLMIRFTFSAVDSRKPIPSWRVPGTQTQYLVCAVFTSRPGEWRFTRI